jgi:hypothetical protein
MHAWADDPPVIGRTVCKRKDCGKVYMMPRRSTTPIALAPTQKVATPKHDGAASAAPAQTVGSPEQAPLAQDKFARFARRIEGVPGPGLDKQAANDNGRGVAVDKATLGKLVEVIGPLAPQLIVAVEATIVRWAGRVPEVPEKEWTDKLRECTDLLIKQNLPDVEIGPWTGLGIYGGMTFLSMYMGAQKLPPKAAPGVVPRTTTPAPATLTARTAATHGAARDSTFPPTTTPAPASLTNESTEGSGNATSAPNGFAEDAPETDFAGNATFAGSHGETQTTAAPIV